MAKDRDYAAQQAAAGQQAGLMLRMLVIRDQLGVTPEEFHVLFTEAGDKHLEHMIAGLKKPVESPKLIVYLQQLYVGETICLDPTDGIKTIARANDVFTGGIDADFTNWNLDVLARATQAMKVGVHETIVNGTFKEIYGSLGHLREQLRLTQAQIINFCVKHRNKLHQGGYGTFFLFKIDDKADHEVDDDDQWFVAGVYVLSDGRLLVRVFRFSFDFFWGAGYPHRFVLPQLEPLVDSVS